MRLDMHTANFLLRRTQQTSHNFQARLAASKGVTTATARAHTLRISHISSRSLTIGTRGRKKENNSLSRRRQW